MVGDKMTLPFEVAYSEKPGKTFKKYEETRNYREARTRCRDYRLA